MKDLGVAWNFHGYLCAISAATVYKLLNRIILTCVIPARNIPLAINVPYLICADRCDEEHE